MSSFHARSRLMTQSRNWWQKTKGSRRTRAWHSRHHLTTTPFQRPHCRNLYSSMLSILLASFQACALHMGSFTPPTLVYAWCVMARPRCICSIGVDEMPTTTSLLMYYIPETFIMVWRICLVVSSHSCEGAPPAPLWLARGKEENYLPCVQEAAMFFRYEA